MLDSVKRFVESTPTYDTNPSHNHANLHKICYTYVHWFEYGRQPRFERVLILDDHLKCPLLTCRHIKHPEICRTQQNYHENRRENRMIFHDRRILHVKTECACMCVRRCMCICIYLHNDQRKETKITINNFFSR